MYLVIISPLIDYYAERADLIENRRMLAPRLDAIAAELPSLRARAAELRASASTRRVTLEGTSDAIASANLQARVEEVAASVGATISSTESLAAENRGPYRRIGLRVALGGEYETLIRFLAALEAANPPLVIDNLTLRGQMAFGVLQPPRTLDAGFEVYGFRIADPAVAVNPSPPAPPPLPARRPASMPGGEPE